MVGLVRGCYWHKCIARKNWEHETRRALPSLIPQGKAIAAVVIRDYNYHPSHGTPTGRPGDAKAVASEERRCHTSGEPSRQTTSATIGNAAWTPTGDSVLGLHAPGNHQAVTQALRLQADLVGWLVDTYHTL